MRRPLIGLLLVAVIAAFALVDRFSSAEPPLPAADTPAHPGGVWACPIVKMEGAAGFIHLVNTGPGSSIVRITYVPDGRQPIERAITLAAGRSTTLGTPGALLPVAAGAVVQYAGGNITASRTAFFGGAGGAAQCTRPGPATVVVPQGSTLKAETDLVILNPTADDAVVDVALLTQNGEPLRPQLLTGRVIPAGSRLVLREGDFAFDVRTVAAMITASTGRVVVDGALVAPATVDIVPAIPAGREVATVANNARGEAWLSVVAVGQNDAVTTARVLTSQGATTFGPLVTALQPQRPLFSKASSGATGPLALHVVSLTSPLVIGARWQVVTRNGSADWAVSSGVVPSRDLFAVLGSPATPAATRLIVSNPALAEAIVNVTVFTERGPSTPSQLQDVHVAPGRTIALAFAGFPPNATLGVEIHAAGGAVVAALEATTTTPLFAAYAVTAVPALSSPPVAVVSDARQGVPAP